MLQVNNLIGFGAGGGGGIALIGTAENQSGNTVTLPADSAEGHLCIGVQIMDISDDYIKFGSPNTDTSGWTTVGYGVACGRYTGGDAYTYDGQWLYIGYRTLSAADITAGAVNVPYNNDDASRQENGFIYVYNVNGETTFSQNSESSSSSRTIDPTAFTGGAVIVWGMAIGGISGISSDPVGDVVTGSDAWDYSPESTAEATDPVGIKLMLKADLATFSFVADTNSGYSEYIESGYIGIGA